MSMMYQQPVMYQQPMGTGGSFVMGGQPMTTQVPTTGMYAAPAPVAGAVYGDPNAMVSYQTLQPMSNFQVYGNTSLPQTATVGPGQPFEVTIGQPEKYTSGSATYYTTSLPNASSLPMVPAGTTPPPIGEAPKAETTRDVKVAKKKPKKKKSCGCC